MTTEVASATGRETAADPKTVGSAADWWEAGFEMGRLDQQLAARVLADQKVGLTIRRVNRGGAEVIARRRGYALHVQEVEEPGVLWAEFWPMGERP